MFQFLAELDVLDDSTDENHERPCPIQATVDGDVQDANQMCNLDDTSVEEQWCNEGWRERLAQLRAEKMPRRNLLRCPKSRHRAIAASLAIEREV